MFIHLRCVCGHDLRVDQEKAGQTAMCPNCGYTFKIPQALSNVVEKECPFCAELIQPKAIKCKHCGEFLPAEPERRRFSFLSTLIIIIFLFLITLISIMVGTDLLDSSPIVQSFKNYYRRLFGLGPIESQQKPEYPVRKSPVTPTPPKIKDQGVKTTKGETYSYGSPELGQWYTPLNECVSKIDSIFQRKNPPMESETPRNVRSRILRIKSYPTSVSELKTMEDKIKNKGIKIEDIIKEEEQKIKEVPGEERQKKLDIFKDYMKTHKIDLKIDRDIEDLKYYIEILDRNTPGTTIWENTLLSTSKILIKTDDGFEAIYRNINSVLTHYSMR